MKKNFKKNLCALFLGSLLGSCAFAAGGPAGTWEDGAPANLKTVLAVDSKLNVSDDELVVYYVRSDANYEPWALWLWALPGGDGSAMWDYSQDWQVMDGIGYMRFKMDGSTTGGIKPVSAENKVGLIVRQDAGWTKDGNDDREWNVSVCNKVVIFSGDQNTYAASSYRPSFKSAELKTTSTVELVLSGNYGLALDGGASGFAVKTADGKSIGVVSAKNTLSSSLADNWTSRVTLTLARPVSLSEEIFVSHPDFAGTASVGNQKLAVELCESTVPGSDVALGASLVNGTASFKLWAPTSSKATVNLYRNATASSPDYTVAMTLDSATGVWSASFSRVNPDGFFYDYTLTNSKGTVTALDPYAKSMAAYTNDGSLGRGAIVDMNSSRAIPEGGFDAPYVQLAQREDAIIYEMSVRDFTISDDSGVSATPGTYKAFIEKIPYLKELGITHVQLMPVVNFYNNNETDKRFDGRGVVNGSNYNWGYDPHNYFTPEGWYASDAEDPYCRIRELRELIDECHKAGIGVLLDVVYNHMAGTQFLDNIVPGYYFRTDDSGKLKSNSGCGNDTATERAMMSRLVEDSTKFWVENYHVDGFRFDLMGLMEAGCVERSFAACKTVNPYTLFEGEGWKMYNGAAGTTGMDQGYMRRTDNVACFSDEIRDILKAGGYNEAGTGFITGKETNMADLFRVVIGNPKSFGTDDPGDSIIYTSCHDGLTLHDAISHNAFLDEAVAGEKAEIIKRIKLANTMVLTSQGISFLHGGQERGRTKPNVWNVQNETVGRFVRNSYDSSDDINQIVWTLDSDYQNLLEYTKGLIELRKTYDVFRLGDISKIKQISERIDTGDRGFVFAYVIHNTDGDWIIAVNASKSKVTIKTGINLKNRQIFVDGNSAGAEAIASPRGVSTSGKNLKLDPLTCTVLRIK